MRATRRAPLDPVDVVVPHATWASWLKVTIASATGIAANLRFPRLPAFLEALAGDRRQILTAGAIESLLLTCFLRDLEAPDLSAVKSYIHAGGGGPDLADMRRVQLAREVAHLCEEYLMTRRDPHLLFEGSEDAARWQRALWSRVFAAGRRSLAEALETLPLDSLRLPKEVHIFGAVRLLPRHEPILRRLAERVDLFLYASNPSREFWDEAMEGESAALRRFGRAGREVLRIANELAGFDFEARFVDPLPADRAPTLLERFQHDVLDSIAGAPLPEPTQDTKSIQFHACPGIRREVEIIARAIWTLVEGDERLRFNQIAVVLAGREADIYRAHIDAVFAENGDLPHHVLEVPMRSASRMLEAIELLFALPFSRFLRQDFLRLLMHPAIAGHVRDTPPEEWVRWIDALGIVHGADRTDHEATYIEKDLYNWDQGMFRLALGAFMSGERSGDQRIFSAKGQDYLPEECALDKLTSVAELVVLVRSLIAEARRLRASEMSLADWSGLMAQLITGYVRPSSEQDERDLFRCLAVIRDLEALDVDRTPISFRIASERALEALLGLRISRGQPLAEGVAVGPLGALSAIPFKVVFIAGLGEGQFPTSETRSSLDLRQRARRGSDVSPRDVETYQFLERILATEQRICFSWVSRETRTGDPLEPSPVLLELMEILEREYLGRPVEAAGLVETHPLRRWIEPGGGPSTEKERRSLELRKDLMAHLERQGAVPEGRAIDLSILRSAVPPDRMEKIAALLGLADPPSVPLAAAGGTKVVEVPYGALRAFLEDPREGWKRFVLNLRDDAADDPLARENETFSANALDASILLREVLFEKLGGAETGVEEIYDRRARILELKGALPTGVFARAERFKHLGILTSWSQHVTALFGERPPFLDALRFGRAREHTKADAFVDPLVFDLVLEGGRDVRVELYGRTEPVLDGSCTLLALAKDMPKSDALREKEALRAFLDGVILSALERGDGEWHRALVLFGSDDRMERRFSRFSAAEARAYLGRLLTDLLSGPHAYVLRSEDVFSAHASGERIETDEPGMEAQIEGRFGPYFARRADGAGVR